MNPRASYLLAGLTISIFAAGAAAGCVVGSQRSHARNQPAYYAPGPRQPSLMHITESYTTGPVQQIGRLPLYLPGRLEQQMVAFQVVNGMAVYEGDIMLGPVASLPLRYGLPKIANPNVKSAVAISKESHLWPKGEIPYTINTSVTSEQRQYIQWAIARINETELEMRTATPADSDYVTFDGAGSGCTSYVGRIKGSQEIQVAGCGQGGSVLHEIAHAAGFYHEQCRSDRDQYVTIVFDEITPDYRFAFEKREGSQNIGPYDYGSIMHYSPRAFSKSGKPTIIPRDPNAKIGQRDGLSPLDRAGITHLYGSTTPPATPPPTVTPPATTPPPPSTTQPPAIAGFFGGNYTSQRGDVTCTQRQTTVTCQYPGGSMICAGQGNSLECGWSGGGQGRAGFARQANGVLAGTWGDFLSNNSRGAWDLVPVGAAPPTPTGTGPGTVPPPPPAQGSLSGSFASTRGSMTCNESGSALTCQFQENASQGQLSCRKDSTGLQLSCTWTTFFPVPGFGQAALSRTSASDRNLTGSWGRFNSASDGGKWDMQGQ